MNQAELLGAPPPAPSEAFFPASPVRAVKDERVALREQLVSLLKRAPRSVANGSVQKVHAWRAASEAAGKVARSERSSGRELRSAILSMQQFGE